MFGRRLSGRELCVLSGHRRQQSCFQKVTGKAEENLQLKMDNFFKHLGLVDWPFSSVPRLEHCTFIGDRAVFKKDLEDLIRSLSRRDTSSIHVFWSWFGAGKTHSLYYLAKKAVRISDEPPLSPVSLEPVYTEFPKSARTFVDLYRTFMEALEVNAVTEAFLEVGTGTTGRLVGRDQGDPGGESGYRPGGQTDRNRLPFFRSLPAGD